jgi:hypothetical protein
VVTSLRGWVDEAAALFDPPESAYRRRSCPVCGGALSVTFAHTYVVQRQGWVKIGATDNVRRRLSELARPAWSKHLVSPDGMDWTAPLTTLAVLDRLLVLDQDTEHDLHRRFAHAHAAGEWFTRDRTIDRWLRQIERTR